MKYFFDFERTFEFNPALKYCSLLHCPSPTRSNIHFSCQFHVQVEVQDFDEGVFTFSFAQLLSSSSVKMIFIIIGPCYEICCVKKFVDLFSLSEQGPVESPSTSIFLWNKSTFRGTYINHENRNVSGTTYQSEFRGNDVGHWLILRSRGMSGVNTHVMSKVSRFCDRFIRYRDGTTYSFVVITLTRGFFTFQSESNPFCKPITMY